MQVAEFPSDRDWQIDEKWSLCPRDVWEARRVFFGRSEVEAKELFRGNLLDTSGLLEGMPPKVLKFYLPACLDYLLSHDAQGDSDGASAFLRTILRLLDWGGAEVRCVVAASIFAIEQVSTRQDFYHASEHIYGNFAIFFRERILPKAKLTSS